MVDQFVKEIKTIIHSEANNNPAPLTGVVLKTYATGDYCDVRLNELEGVLKYVPCNSLPKLNDTVVVVFIDGDFNSPFAITGGNVDLSDYYTV